MIDPILVAFGLYYAWSYYRLNTKAAGSYPDDLSNL